MNKIIEKIQNDFYNKTILILGFGKEGQSTYRFFRKLYKDSKISIADKLIDYIDSVPEVETDNNVKFYIGDNYLEVLNNEFDYIFKTPGLPLKNIDFKKIKGKLTSQSNEFLRYYKNNTIGITGTKGKSTTSSIMYECLKNYGMDIELVGNIGYPAFDLIIDKSEETKYIYEFSSHQLEILEYSPHISIILNIFEEHLDHYKSYQEYISAKLNIMKFQNKDDYFIFYANNDVLKKYINQSLTQKTFEISEVGEILKNGLYVNDAKIFYKNSGSIEELFDTNFKRLLLGNHNLTNILFVLCVCKILQINDFSKILESIANFKGLPHRLEFVGEYNKVKFYNDSIATIPEATISAVKSLEPVATLILGGFNRGISYERLIEFLDEETNLKNVICMYDTGEIIYKELSKCNKTGKNLYNALDLETAIKIACQNAPEGSVCLLSPAAASYGVFKNFIERGDKYKECIEKYAKLTKEN